MLLLFSNTVQNPLTRGQVRVKLSPDLAIKPVKVWDGSTWVKKNTRFWDGSSWIYTFSKYSFYEDSSDVGTYKGNSISEVSGDAGVFRMLGNMLLERSNDPGTYTIQTSQ